MQKGGSHEPPCSGEYRSRTGDLLHAMQALWPAELIPQNVNRFRSGRTSLFPNGVRI